MKKFTRILSLAVLVLLAASCPNNDNGVRQAADTYNISIGRNITNGQILLSHDKAKPNTQINVYVNPDPGYVLKLDSLKRVTVQGDIPFPRESLLRYNNPFSFSMGSTDVTIEAEFVDLATADSNDPTSPKRNYKTVKTVSIEKDIKNAVVYAVPMYGYPPDVEIPRDPAAGSDVPNDPNPQGSLITIQWVPDPGYMLKELKINNVVQTSLSQSLFEFRIGTENVTISAKFAKPETSEDLLYAGRDAMNSGQYDQAAGYYNEAYRDLPNDPEAIFYSTLAQLGGILIKLDVRNILSSFGMSVVPSTFDDWVCDPDTWRKLETEDDRDKKRWYTEYLIHNTDDIYDPTYDPDEPYTENQYLPRMNSMPQGFPGGFLNYDVVHKGTNDLGDPYRTYFDQLLFWNLIANHPDGFNNKIDDVLNYVFGSDYAEAKTRAAKLTYDDKVLLNAQLKKRLKLDELFGAGDTYVGKAELDVIFAYCDAIKAGFEYLASYNWDMELRVWRVFGIENKETLNTIVQKLFKEAETGGSQESLWTNPASFARILPIKNSLLLVRDASKIATSKATLTSALNTASAAMDKYFEWADSASSDRLSAAAKTNFKTKYRWIKAGLDSAKTTLASNGTFYFPKTLPKPEDNRSTWYDQAQADFGVSWGGFFTSGAFSLGNLFTLDGTSAPAFYRINWDWSSDGNYNIAPSVPAVGVKMDNAAQFDTIVSGTTAGPTEPNIFTWQVKTSNLKAIFPKYPRSSGHGDTAYFHEVFETIPLWPNQPVFLDMLNWTSTETGTAKQLYEYYHK